ncbi:MAG: 50S ribosomal protein L30e [Methanomassiliicoccales archaeon]|nr:MAG: 50S ribosomal protein L30e [Methanomassiliicoccales archaeon]
MDINKALKTAVLTGKVLFGFEQTMKAVSTGKAKLIIVSQNCPDEHLSMIKKHKKIPYFKFDGTNIELGSACGKPFSVSMLSILSAGESEILALGTRK